MKSHIKSIIVTVAALSLGACATMPKVPVYQVNAKVMSVTKAPEVCTEEIKKTKSKTSKKSGWRCYWRITW